MTPKDHALAVIKAALNLDPTSPTFGVGGAVSSLISDYVPTSRQRSLEEAVKNFSEKVAEIESRIKPDAINKKDFAELFGQFEALAAKTNREEKLRTAANILANALLPADDQNRSPFDELDHLMHCVDALSTPAITVLGASIQVVAQRGGRSGNMRFQFAELRQKLPDGDPNVIFGCATELRSLNLLQISEALVGGPNPENHGYEVTPVGLRFAQRFIEGRM
jgi:hypothetical protein